MTSRAGRYDPVPRMPTAMWPSVLLAPTTCPPMVRERARQGHHSESHESGTRSSPGGPAVQPQIPRSSRTGHPAPLTPPILELWLPFCPIRWPMRQPQLQDRRALSRAPSRPFLVVLLPGVRIALIVRDGDRPTQVLAGMRGFYEQPPGPAADADPAESALAVPRRGGHRPGVCRLPPFAWRRRRVRVQRGRFRPPAAADQGQLSAAVPAAELCRDGRLDACDMVAVSSGSTGTPTFWPRFVADELPIAARFEQVFHDSFRADDTPHARRRLLRARHLGRRHVHRGCCRHLAAKGYPITWSRPATTRRRSSASCRSSARRSSRWCCSAIRRSSRTSSTPGARAASTGGATAQAGDGRRGVQRGVARPGRRAARASHDPLLRLGLALRHRRRRRARQRDAADRSPSAASWPRSPDAARDAVRRVAAADAGAVRPAQPLSSRPTTARCCSPATTACRWSATTSPTRAALVAVRRDAARSCAERGFDPLASCGQRRARRAAAAVRVRVRPLALHRLVLRRQRLSRRT